MSDLPVEKNTRILVVQDDPVMLALVSGSLRPEAHEIIETPNPLEALTIAAREHERIDLILARIDSRPITGIEFSKRLNRRGIEVPTLFISASHTLSAVISASFGPSSVIQQPFTGAELRAAVKRCMATHRRKVRSANVQTPPSPTSVPGE
jgi:DNA-binding NtrC family response regulator